MTDARVPAAVLIGYCTKIFERVGVPHDQAGLVCESLVDANLRGTDTHGVCLVPPYVNLIAEGRSPAHTVVTVERDDGATALLDGGRGFGQVAGVRAVDLAVEKARLSGVGMVGVRNGGHLAALGWFARRGAAQGFVTLVVQNAQPWVPPFGGRTPMFGTNPLAFAVPTANSPLLVCDIATTTVARRRLDLARERDEVIPDSWALDADGEPTTDPHRASDLGLQWAGGHKGFVIGLLVEILSGVLTGSSYGLTNREDAPGTREPRTSRGHAVLAADPARFGPADEFDAAMDDLVAQIRDSEPAAGFDDVRLPGDRADREYADRLARGIPVPPPLRDALEDAGRKYGVDDALLTRT